MKHRPGTAVALVALAALTSAACHHRRGAASAAACVPSSEALAPNTDLSRLNGAFDLTLVATAGPQSGQSVTGRLALRPQAGSLVSLPPRQDPVVTTQPVIGQLDVAPEAVGAVRVGDAMSADSSLPGVGVYASRRPSGELTALVVRVGSGSNYRGVESYEGTYFTLFISSVATDGIRGSWRSGGVPAEPPVEARGHFCATKLAG